MKEIELTQGKVALVDDEDFESLSKYKWYAHKRNHHWYAERTIKTETGRKAIKMHRVILDTPNGYQSDHINHDGLDNRRENLRVATNQENQFNRRKTKNNTSGFKGVYFDKSENKFKAQMTFKGKVLNLGWFLTAEDASEAYQTKAKELHGEFYYASLAANAVTEGLK